MSKWVKRKVVSSDDTDELTFQCLDWYCEDFENENSKFEYKIFVFGVTKDSCSVTLRINNFCPFFFIEIPSSFDQNCIYSVKNALNYTNLKSIEYLERKRYYGFENNKIRKFLKLTFYSSKSMRSLKYKIANNTFNISGKDYSFPLYESHIDPLLRFTHMRDILPSGWVTAKKCEYSESELFYETDWKNISSHDQLNDSNVMSNVRVLYFDIEACSEDGSFPNALKPNDKVTQICCIISESGLTEKYLFNLGTCDPIDNTIVLQYKSEKALLTDYSNFIKESDPDVIVGYNIFGFDNGFLFERASVLGIESVFNYQSKLPEYFTTIQKKTLNNQQSGFNDWKMTRLVGRTHIDLLQVIKKDFKLESYKLNNVGEHFLGEGKDDVSPKEIFEAWSKDKGTREKRTKVGKYCVQDTNLCLLLFEKFAVLPNHIEMAKVTRVPIEFLITRGQSIKVFSQIAYETRKKGFLIPVLPMGNKEEKFQGATVLEAKVGYYQKPVAGLDFASLYPSIMIAHNMCYSTVVLDQRYMNLPDIEYSTIECNENTKFSFVQNQPGVLSGILQNLWKTRKVTKKAMNQEKDPFIKTVLNAKQLAIKVSMNSIYGFTGAVVGVLPCLEISQSVTGCGRQMIEQTCTLARERFNGEVVYGDSVTGDTPVLVRINNFPEPIIISELFENYPVYTYEQFKSEDTLLTHKEQSIPDNYIEAWTTTGWKRIKRIIRHHTYKKIYRILTNTGFVDVTEDHSLLDIHKNQLKPKDLKLGTELYHSYPEITKIINNKYFRYFIAKRKAAKDFNNFTLTTRHKLTASYFYMIGKYYNMNTHICVWEDETIYINFSTTRNYLNKNTKKVYCTKNTDYYVYDLETEDSTFQAGVGEMIVKNTDSCYVIFPEPVDPDGTLTTLFKVAERAAKEISATFKPPIELEHEKFMMNFVLYAKKKYIYVEWTNPKHHNGCIEAKGVELARRDNCQYVKDTLEAVLQPIMFQNNLSLGISEAERCIDNLLQGNVEIKKLMLSKTLKNEYKNPDTIAHYQLVQKIKSRDPNGAPKPGDRIPFVYVDIADPKALSWKKVEDPVYVVENKIPIDYLYYFEHQLKSPLEALFNILLGQAECKKLFERKSVTIAKKREKEIISDAKRIKERNKDIRDFFF